MLKIYCLPAVYCLLAFTTTEGDGGREREGTTSKRTHKTSLETSVKECISKCLAYFVRNLYDGMNFRKFVCLLTIKAAGRHHSFLHQDEIDS